MAVISSQLTVLYDPRAFIAHAASLRQAFAHCAKFPTAASRRSLDRVSVPVWLIILSDQLPVVALVSHYLTNKLIGRELILWRQARRSPAFLTQWSYPVLAILSDCYPRPQGRYSRVTHPCAALLSPKTFRARLACVRRAANVRSEPGSNSPIQTWIA